MATARTLPPTLPRPRLEALFRGRWKAALLTAPAGYGKSTLALQLARPHPALWVRVLPEHRDTRQLLGALLESAHVLRPNPLRRTAALFSSMRDMDRDGGLLTSSLLQEWGARTRETWLVLDDVHHLAGARAALTWMARLLEGTGPRVRVVLTCRGECPVPLGRLELLGGVRRAGAEALEFQPGEERALLEQGFRLRLKRSEREALRASVHGWPAGLVLAAQSLRALGKGASPERLLSPERHVSAAPGALPAFLADEVFRPLPTDLRGALCRAALLEDLEPEALAVVLGRAAARRLLEEVRRRDLFLRTLPDGGGGERFHPLFREYLRGELERMLPAAELRRLVQRLARHWLDADNPGRAARLLAETGELERSGSAEALQAESRHALEAGRYVEAVRLARSARAAGGVAFAVRAFRTEALCARFTAQAAQAAREGERLIRTLSRAPAVRAALLVQVGDLWLQAGELRKARLRLDAAMAGLRHKGSAVDRAEAEVRLGTLEFIQGRWDRYVEYSRRALEVFLRAGLHTRAQSLHINIAEALIYLGEEERALPQLHAAESLAWRTGFPHNRAYAALGHARACSELGRLDEASRHLAQARARAGEVAVRTLPFEIDVWEGVLERRRGRLAAAWTFLDRATAEFARLESPSWHNLARMERALVLGLRGEVPAALRELRACAKISQDLHDPKEQVRNLLYQARLKQLSGQPHARLLAQVLRDLDAMSYRVLLRKEQDLAGPLLAPATPAAPPSAKTHRAAPGAPRKGPSREGTLELSLLGAAEVRVAGHPAHFPRRAALHLVAYLALRRGLRAGRDSVLEALWPNAGGAGARNRFDVALNAVRRALEPDVPSRGPFHLLVGDSSGYRLEFARGKLDVQVFEDAAAACEPLASRILSAPFGGPRRLTDPAALRELHQLERATELYRGDLLGGEPLEGWLEGERARLRGRCHRLLLAHAVLAWQLAKVGRTAACAGKILESDPLHEEACRLLVLSLAAQGRRAEALRQGREFCRRLRREVGVEPGPELAAALREVEGD